MMVQQSSKTQTNAEQKSVQIEATLKCRGTALNNGTTLKNVPIVAGLCLPKGQLRDARTGHVEGFASGSVSAQFEVLNRWNDGSARWLLASFVAPESSAPQTAVTIHAMQRSESDDSSTRFMDRLGSTTVKLHNGEISLETRDICSHPPTERTLHLTPLICSSSGEELGLTFDGIREEVIGPVRQVFVVSARLSSLPAVTIQFRLTYWASAGLLQVETRLRNTQRAKHAGGLWDLGDAGSFLFRSLEVSIRSDEVPANAITQWKAERTGTVRTTTSEVFLRQRGSGDRFWASSNHVVADNSIGVECRGYEAHSEHGTLRGYRAEPTLHLIAEDAAIAVAVPEFWQNFPGSIDAAMGTLAVGLFPASSEVAHELQGGEQKTQSFWIALGTTAQHNQVSVPPDSETWIGGRNVIDVNSLDWVYDAPCLIQSPESINRANVLPWFSAPNADAGAGVGADPGAGVNVGQPAGNGPGSGNTTGTSFPVSARFANYLQLATSGRHHLDERRASIDEYGWRNFGEIPADHEQTHYAGSNTIVSHYNNQFDMVFGGILQLVATGDLKWRDLFEPLARHVMDIDIYHTAADRAAFNGGLFWHTDHYVDAHTCTHRTYSKHNQQPGQSYGGGPSCEHNYTTGLLYYHFLTGNVEARESVLSLAEWVINMDDGHGTVFGLLDHGPTGLASATVFEDYHGPGRGAGNSINALLDAWILTGSSRYMTKLEELIRRCVHPSQNPEELHLLEAEGHWSYTVFLNSLGRYLLAKRDALLFDSMYTYAQETLKTFGRWMAIHERRTLDRPEELQYPTEAWAAQDFRKANVLRIAASCENDATLAESMRAKANQINDAAWVDFEAFGEASLTARCLSIVMTEGRREVFHRECPPDFIPSCDAAFDTSKWTMFIPQKHRVKSLFRSPARLLKASLSALNPTRMLQTVQALRRQM